MKSSLARKLRPVADAAEFEIPPIADDPEYQAISAEIAALEKRLTESERREQAARARARGAVSNRNLADALVAGASIPGHDPAREVEAAQLEASHLRARLGEKRAELDAVVGARSYDLARKFLPQHEEALRAIDDGLTVIADALEAIIVARQRRVAAGFRDAEYALPSQIPLAVQALGNPRRRETVAGAFRAYLQQEGIVPEGWF